LKSGLLLLQTGLEGSDTKLVAANDSFLCFKSDDVAVLDSLSAAQAYFMLDWSEEERGLEEGELAYCDECEDVKLADDVKNCGEAGNICKDCLDAARRRGLELQEAHEREMAKFCAKCGVNLRQEKDELCPSCRKEETEDEDSNCENLREYGIHQYRAVCDGDCNTDGFCKCDMNVCLVCGHRREEGEQG
jgi:hypothetical protein